MANIVCPDYIHILHTFMLYRTFKTVKDEVQKEYLLKICNLISKKKKPCWRRAKTMSD